MKKLFTLLFALVTISAIAQPMEETILTNNFTDPYCLKAADMDMNGHDDLVAAGVGGISWFSNTDGNNFETYNILDSFYVRDIELIDYDFDSDLDIIGINSSANTIFWLDNDGSMNFTYNVITNTLTDLRQMRAVDMENDGDIDILYSVYSGGFYNIHLYEMTVSGFVDSFVDRVDFSRDIYVFDYEGDNDMDFLSKTNYSPFTTEELAVMVNDGSNTFSELRIYEKTGDIDISDAQFIDLDNNGTGDIVIADSQQDELYWIEIASSTRHNILSSESVRDVLVQDYNNDGINDISYKYETIGNYDLIVLQGSNPGPSMSFTEVFNYDLDVLSTDLVPIDTDSDNLPEFAYSAANRDEVGFMKNNDLFSFTLTKIATYISAPDCMRRIDLDKDGDQDIVCFASEEEMIWMDRQADGTYTQRLITGALDNPYQLEVEDVNGDTHLDIISASVGDDDFSLWLNDGSQNFTEQQLTSSPSELSNPSYFALADLDNDTDKDFVIIAASTSSSYPYGIFWIRNEGGGTYSSPIAIEDNLSLMGEVVVHDFDNDGFIDIIVADGPYGTSGLRVIKNNGGTSFTINQPVSFKTECLRLGDIDSDGLMDFITRDDVNNDIKWFKSNGDLTFTENTIAMSEVRDVRFETCDDTNDGDTDILFYTNYYGFTNTTNFTVGILKNDGSQNFSQSYFLENQTNILSAIPINIDGDHDIDFFMGFDYADKISYFENLSIPLIDPTVSEWPDASDITYGEPLSNSILSGGTASTAGTFVFANPSILPDAGTYAADVIFIPDDISTYNTVNGTVDVTVYKANPTVTTWPTASDITYGDPLSMSVLSGGVASVSGTFTFDSPAVIPDAGTYTADLTFTPDDNTNYNTVSGTVDVTVYKADPTVTTWPTASDITYGDPLSMSVLSGGVVSVSGTFTFDSPALIPDAGTYTADLTFTPDDNANYNTVSGTVDVTVNKANPTVTTWPTASDITYGDPLSMSVLSGGVASVSGTFTFDNPALIPDAGTYTADLTFTPDDNANYNTVGGTVDVTVYKADPTVTTWPTASDITYGDPLSMSVLSGGVASVSGTFTFDNPALIPDAGTYTADLTFTPDDNTNYNTVSGTVDVTVNKADQTIEWLQDLSNLTIGDIITLTAEASSGLDVVYSTDNPDIVEITGDQLEVIDSGTAVITASQEGDGNFNPADDVSKTIDIPVNIFQAASGNSISLYPVPAKDFIMLKSEKSDIQAYIIFDNIGRIIKFENELNIPDKLINISGLRKGMYSIIISSDNNIIGKVFVKL